MELLHHPIVLVLLFLAGIVTQFLTPKRNVIYKKINRFILYLPLPAIVLSKIPFLPLNKEVAIPVASAWILFIACIIFTYGMKLIFHFSKETFACIILCCGLGNTSFVGYPFLTFFYGSSSLQYAIFVDQPGSFLIMSTAGIMIAAYYSSGHFSILKLIKHLFAFPPFLVFILSLFIPKEIIHGNVFSVLEFLGAWMVPLALLSLGMQFKLNIKKIPLKPFLVGVTYKLILGPLLIYILIFWGLKKNGLMYDVTLLECAMPPMITSSIMASNFGLDEDLAALFPTLGLLLSALTLCMWKLIL